MNVKKFGIAIRLPIDDPDVGRPGHIVTVPKDPTWLARRKEFLVKWRELEKLGLSEGYLEADACYECPGAVLPTTDDSDSKWVWDDELDSAH